MAVPDEYVGVPFRQISDTLRWKRGRERPASLRPLDAKKEKYIDSMEQPTLVTFEKDDEWVNVDLLLQQGAIARWTPPKKAAKADADEHPAVMKAASPPEGD